MAHIKKHPGAPKPYEVRWSWYDGEGKRKLRKQRFRTKTEADQFKRDLENQQASGLSTDNRAGKETLGAWAERWHRSRQHTVKPSTLRKDRGLLDSSILPTFGATRLRDIKTGDIVDFVQARLAAGNTPPTVRHHYLALRAVLQFAANERAIALNPAIGVRLPTDRSTGRTKPQPRFLSEAQVADVAQVLDGAPPYGLLVRFMAYTGMRVSEVSGLNIGDVDTDRGTVRVERTRTRARKVDGGGWAVHVPKTGEGRIVDMPPWLTEDMRAYLASHPNRDNDDAALWPGRRITAHTRQGNESELDWDAPWCRDTFYRRHFRPALTAAGLPAMRLHDLRHTYASISAHNGIPVAVVSRQLGHRTPLVTTTIYTHLFAEDVAQHVARLRRPAPSKDNVVQFPAAN